MQQDMINVIMSGSLLSCRGDGANLLFLLFLRRHVCLHVALLHEEYDSQGIITLIHPEIEYNY